MPDTAVASLDLRLQRQAESARTAFAKGRFADAAELSRQILAEAPGCLAVRKLQRAAQTKAGPAKGGGFFAKAMGSVTSAPFLLTGRSAMQKEPLKAALAADKILAHDPIQTAALRLLGQAAAALGWTGTAIFAHGTVRELEPDSVPNLVALGEALLAEGRGGDALQAAEAALRLEPAHPGAQNLAKNASVATTMAAGNWEGGGNYREKLRDEQKAIDLEQAAKLVKQQNPPTSS
ncbi:MAG: hypothetical protein HY302_14480 [Opitutae bacterium]|nr:hypothetical protein [Opitutae bacterium]